MDRLGSIGIEIGIVTVQMVLSACSTYFEQLFLEHLEANPIVIMRETSFNDLVIIVEFMYKGEINVSQVIHLELFIFIKFLYKSMIWKIEIYKNIVFKLNFCFD